MNYFLSLFLVTYLFIFPLTDNGKQQAKVLQSTFDIEEFQKYLSYSPRFVGTNTKQEILMMDFPGLEDHNAQLTVGRKSIRIISQQDIDELDHNFFIRIDEFELKKSKAEILLSYQNARMYYEKKQKVLLDAQLEKTEGDEWTVVNYKLYEVSINTSD